MPDYCIITTDRWGDLLYLTENAEWTLDRKHAFRTGNQTLAESINTKNGRVMEWNEAATLAGCRGCKKLFPRKKLNDSYCIRCEHAQEDVT